MKWLKVPFSSFSSRLSSFHTRHLHRKRRRRRHHHHCRHRLRHALHNPTGRYAVKSDKDAPTERTTYRVFRILWKNVYGSARICRGRDHSHSPCGRGMMDLQLGSLRSQRRYRRHTLHHPLRPHLGLHRRQQWRRCREGGGWREGARRGGRSRSRPACCRRCHS